MKDKKIIVIDSKNKKVYESNYKEVSDLQKIVGGYIELAHEINKGDSINDIVFVNDEGLLCEPRYFFTIKGGYQPFAGNGVVVGTNIKNGKSINVQSTLEEIENNVSFFSLEDVRQYYN